MKVLLLVGVSAAAFLSLVLATTSRGAPGDLYVPQASEGTILKFSPDGTKSTFVSGLDHPGGALFDRAGNLFVSVGPGQFRDITRGRLV